MDATLLPVLSRWTDADAGVDPIAGHLPPGMACVDGLAASPDEARARAVAAIHAREALQRTEHGGPARVDPASLL